LHISIVSPWFAEKEGGAISKNVRLAGRALPKFLRYSCMIKTVAPEPVRPNDFAKVGTIVQR